MSKPSKTKAALDEALSDFAQAQEALENVFRVEAKGAHIAYSCVEYPNARVHLDVVGNVVSVEFDDPGWDAT